VRVPFRRREEEENKVGAWDQWKILPEVLPYLRPYRKLVIVSFALTIAAAAVGLAEPWPLALVIDDVIGASAPPSLLQPLFGDNPDPYKLLLFIAGFGFLISTASHAVRVIENYVNAKIEQNIVLDLRSDLFNHVTQLSLTYHDERHTGMLMGLVNQQAHSLGAIVMSFPPLFESALMLIGMLVIALLIDWQVTLVSLVCVPFIYWAIGLYGTRIVPRIQRVQSLELRSLSIVFEAMTMLPVITSFGRRRLEHYRFNTQGKTAVDARVRLTVHQTMFSLGVSTAIALGTAIVLGFGAYHVLQGHITLGEMIVLISYISSVYQPLEQISATIGSLHQSFVFLNASFSILAVEPEVVERPGAIDIGRSSGAVSFENVSFAYKDRQGTIRNVSFSCKAGDRVAVVGPTGAGKTTLMNLLIRFYDPAEGIIRIDGHDTRDLTLDCLRNQLSLVMQVPRLFSGSIADNLRYGKLDATMDEIVAAAKAANCHEFITGLPDGYETTLGEGGAQLSGGERQRIAVARAFIRGTPILILDEPTSAIDSKTEEVILDALETLMKGRTSFMIAHRLSTVRDADLILVMNHGEVVESGTHDELLASGGLYYQLYEAQTGRAAAIEAHYAQEALASGDSKLGVQDILAEVATAEALARYEQDHPPPPEPEAAPAGHENGGQPPAAPEPDRGLRAPVVPQPHAGPPPAAPEPDRGLRAPVVPQPHAGPPPAPPAPAAPAATPPSPPAPDPAPSPVPPPSRPANGTPAKPEDQPEVSEQVIETLTEAVRQRIRQALSTSTSTGTAAERREHGRIDTGDPVPGDGTQGSNGAQDQDGPGSDGPGSSPFSAGHDAGV
jgi:ATP-binding cassette subfamily B protein/subfamily B ATP-binding cassette protein MsbA